jgi:DHA1 family bicyclomycin/chloramphenicol resistance-like MFS transporter
VCFVTLSAYIGSAPAIILDHWHMRETSFSALTIPIVGGFALGAFLSGRLAGHMRTDRQISLGFGVSVGIAAIMLAVQTIMPEAPILLQQVLLTLSATGMQLMFPVMTLRILDMFATARGAAASAHAFFSTMLSAIMMGLMAPWLSYSMTRLAVAALVVSVAGSLLWRWSLWSDRPQAEQSLA